MKQEILDDLEVEEEELIPTALDVGLFVLGCAVFTLGFWAAVIWGGLKVLELIFG